jgi:hypothetical protein
MSIGRKSEGVKGGPGGLFPIAKTDAILSPRFTAKYRSNMIKARAGRD